jgi:hypothetical protein
MSPDIGCVIQTILAFGVSRWQVKLTWETGRSQDLKMFSVFFEKASAIGHGRWCSSWDLDGDQPQPSFDSVSRLPICTRPVRLEDPPPVDSLHAPLNLQSNAQAIAFTALIAQ